MRKRMTSAALASPRNTPGPVPGVAGVEQNGKLTQGEDTADNGGLYLALSALTEDLKQQGKTLDDKDENGLTTLQRFFIAYGNELVRPDSARGSADADSDQSALGAVFARQQRGFEHAGIPEGVWLQAGPGDGACNPVPGLVSGG